MIPSEIPVKLTTEDLKAIAPGLEDKWPNMVKSIINLKNSI